jgi:hypothetical protein
MVGNKLSNAASTTDYENLGGLAVTTTGRRLYVPFQFWFNRNPGLALPLIALQYHEVKLNLELRAYTDLLNVSVVPSFTSTSLTTCKLYVDYVYLDTDERRRFAQVSHEYLIEQVQFTGTETIAAGSSNKNVTLNFNHPVKELIWAHTTAANATGGIGAGTCRWFNYSGLSASGLDSFTTALLQLNGHDRFSVRQADYFRKVQNYEHHTRVPRVGGDLAGTTADALQSSFRQYIYSYSFAISPEEHQPSGTCNFSRIDNAVLQLTYNKESGGPTYNTFSLNLNIYAVNYNVLRIMSGMGGLAYSN